MAADETRPEVGKIHPPDLAGSRQLVLVVAPGWESITAELRCFARADADAPWKEVFAPTPAMIGRSGLAWGIGLHGTFPPGDEHVKHEGDGRAPAGAFLLPSAFGYTPAADARITEFPYQPLTPTVEGVDDPASRYYNRVVDSAGLADKDWKSSEQMRRDDDLYRWGVIVAHNSKPRPGYGSCIFLHVWGGAGHSTSGCTAMPAEYLEPLIRWLDQRSHPVLVQLPAEEYRRLKTEWRLP